MMSEITELARIENSYNNYLTHRWETSTDRYQYKGEKFCFCLDCGCENQGDPREFEWLDYPDCKVRDMV